MRTVRGPYRDARDARRPWAVTIRDGVNVTTLRFEKREAATAHARASRPSRRPKGSR